MAVTYKTIISQVISDFDAIQQALRDKGVKDSNGSLLDSPSAANSVLIPTANLSTMINDQLQIKGFKVDNVGDIDSSGYYPYSADGKSVLIKSASGIELSGGSASITNKAVTSPKVTINTSGTGFVASTQKKYGITTTKPTGTDGTNYLTLGISHSENNGSITADISRAAISFSIISSGWLSNQTTDEIAATTIKNAINDTSIAPSITNNFPVTYIPVVSPAFSGGGLSVSKSTTDTGDISGGTLTGGTAITPTLTMTLDSTDGTATGESNTNIYNATSEEVYTTEAAAKSAGYDYFIKVNTGSSSGSSTVTRSKITRKAFAATVTRAAMAYSGAANGLVSVSDGTQILDSGTANVTLASDELAAASKTVTVNANSKSGFIGIKKAAITDAATSTIAAPKISLNTADTNTSDSYINVTDKLLGTNGTASKTEPDSTYYIRLNTAENATGVTGTVKATSAGYVPAGNVGTSKVTLSGSTSQIFAVTAGSCTITGGGLSKGTASGGGISGGDLSGGGLTAGAGSVSLSKSTTAGSNTNSSNIATASGDITTTEPTSGFYVRLSASGSGTVNRAAVTRSKITRAAFSQTVNRAAVTDAHTAGYIPAKDSTVSIAAASSTVTLDTASINADSTTIPAAQLKSNTATTTYYLPIASGSLASATSTEAADTYKSYTTLSTPTLSAEGYLIINHGYYQDSKISLATLIPDDADYSNAGVGQIRLGFEAYTPDGKKLIGTMPDVTPSFSGGAATSITTITTNTKSPANKGSAINYNTAAEAGSTYVTVSASGTGGANAITYANAYAGYLSVSSGTAAKSAVSTSSSDTNYIPATETSSFEANHGTFTTSATITSKTARGDASGNDKGYAINTDDIPAQAYVKVTATSSGTGSAGTNKTLSVKDKYMLNNVTVSAPAPTAVTNNSDTNYILAFTDSTASLAGGTFSTTASIATHTSRGTASGYDNGFAINAAAAPSSTPYVKVTATSSGTGTAPASSELSTADKYMLNNLKLNGAAPTKSSSGSATTYISADLGGSKGSTAAGTVSGVCNSPSVGTATSFTTGTSSVTMSRGSKTAATSASISTNTAGSSTTVAVADKYMLSNITVAATKSNVSISSGTATINADATGSSVDDALLSLYNRINGFDYTEIPAE